MKKNDTEVLTGTILKIKFFNQNNNYAILEIKTDKKEIFSVTGLFKTCIPQVDEQYSFTGCWNTHPIYGLQFNFTNFTPISSPLFDELNGLKKYLQSGVLPGVGPEMANKIIESFGKNALQILQADPTKIKTVKGLSLKKADKIVTYISSQAQAFQDGDVLTFLYDLGLNKTVVQKILKQYKTDTTQVVTSNPYQLITDIAGVGFLTADQAARKLGLESDTPARIQAGCLHVLNQAAEEGHTLLFQNLLVARIQKLLNTPISTLDSNLIIKNLGILEQKNELIRVPASNTLFANQPETELEWFLPRLFKAEEIVVHKIHKLLELRCTKPIQVQLFYNWCEHYQLRNPGILLTEEQKNAILTATQSGISVITGGPGCGKTTILKVLVEWFQYAGLQQIEIAAPTGRAAQKLTETTNFPAKTIHRLLGKNLDRKLSANLVIIDEASMLDIELCSKLLKSLNQTARIIFVGDADQLPSVGPGRFLADLVGSPRIPTTKLTQVFRQAQESSIIRVAHQIRNGRISELLTPDCQFIHEENASSLQQSLLQFVIKELANENCNDLIQDIQVLTPMNRGNLGTIELNLLLQKTLNPSSPDKPEYQIGNTIFRKYDKVVQKINNYDLEVFNGEVGVIVDLDRSGQWLRVQYRDKEVSYPRESFSELMLGYALSVHKSQGTEYKVILLVLHTQAYLLLSRNLLYTALTRASQRAYIFYNSKALQLSLNKIEAYKRLTGLSSRI